MDLLLLRWTCPIRPRAGAADAREQPREIRHANPVKGPHRIRDATALVRRDAIATQLIKFASDVFPRHRRRIEPGIFSDLTIERASVTECDRNPSRHLLGKA